MKASIHEGDHRYVIEAWRSRDAYAWDRPDYLDAIACSEPGEEVRETRTAVDALLDVLERNVYVVEVFVRGPDKLALQYRRDSEGAWALVRCR